MGDDGGVSVFVGACRIHDGGVDGGRLSVECFGLGIPNQQAPRILLGCSAVVAAKRCQRRAAAAFVPVDGSDQFNAVLMAQFESVRTDCNGRVMTALRSVNQFDWGVGPIVERFEAEFSVTHLDRGPIARSAHTRCWRPR